MSCNAMYVKNVEDRKDLQYTQDLMLWNFFRIENLLNIKEVMGKNMFVIFWASFEAFDQLFIFITIFDTFDMKVIT